MTTAKKPAFNAYTVTGEGENAFWTKIGAAWDHKKGGYTLDLAALPVNGRIILMPPKAEAESDQAQ